MDTYYFAVDLGATSGRTIIGKLADGKAETRELTRFENRIVRTGGHCYWDLFALYNEVVRGLKTAHDEGLTLRSIGIDTWGCDFACVGDDGALLRNPLSYRDPHTMCTMDDYFAHALPREEVYRRTGIEFMNFNSLFQLHQMRRDHNTALRNAKKVLFTPDALTYMLTGKAICEYTIASTSEMLNPREKDLDATILSSLGMTRGQFGTLTMPGTVVGTLTDEVQRLTGLGAVPVVAVAGHDTASAVAAVPASDRHFAYLSSGTWSLMGIESETPIINKESYRLNFTNEGGVDGTTRFLKNICGMWLYERCRQEWPGLKALGHAELQRQAMGAEAFRSIIQPDAPDFANPDSMTLAIDAYCERTAQSKPTTPAAYCRCIFDSLALRYRQVMEWLRGFADFDIRVLHVIGGGSRNVYLDQFTADSCNVPVQAGPQECTALGNILLQAKAAGEVGDIWQMRRVVADTVETKTFAPHHTEAWDKAYERYLKL